MIDINITVTKIETQMQQLLNYKLALYNPFISLVNYK